MKLNLRSILATSCAAVMLFAVTSAKADTLNGSVWVGGTTSNVPVTGSSIYSTTPTDTFTVSNPSSAAILSFSSGDDSSLTGFLTAGGDMLTYHTGGDGGINNDLFQFTGSVSLTNGTYTYQHDDGMILYLNGTAVINDPGPTSATPTSFTVCASGCDATAGTYSFELDYAEVAGPPAVLSGNLPLSATPEPSSFMLLGSGLLGAAGMLRRRMKS
jgi:hypothetical protein